jgi:hypothetical protein
MKELRREIGAVWPYQRVELRVDAIRAENFGIAKRFEHRSRQFRTQVNFSRSAIPKSKPQHVIPNVTSFQDVVLHGVTPGARGIFGTQFGASGFGIRVTGLAPGAYRLVAFGLLTATGRFDLVRFVGVNVLHNVFVAIDLPRPGTTVDRPFVIAGWAADAAARSGTGVDAIHIWAYPALGGAPLFLGVAS